MSRYILDNKIYDTEKSEEIMKYGRSVKHKGIITTYPLYIHTLYKTEKGNFFVHVGKYFGKPDILYSDKDYIETITKEEVKQILEKFNRIDEYEELFGETEEA